MAVLVLILTLSLTILSASPYTLQVRPRSSLPPSFQYQRADFPQFYTLESAPIIPGLSQGLYLAKVGIGNPPQFYYWLIDTGSDVIWLQCLPCQRCYRQANPIFNPASSSTFRPLPCGKTCESFPVACCKRGGCKYMLGYADDSKTAGDAATEMLTFDNSQRVGDVVIGCGHNSVGDFSGYAGLIGLGRGPLSLPSQLRATSFSYCLASGLGNSTTLEFNISALPGSIQVPVVTKGGFPTYWYIELDDISVGGQPLSLPASTFSLDPATGRGGTVVDSGTVVTTLSPLAYLKLRDEFVKRATNLERADRFDPFDTCFISPAEGIDALHVPEVALIFPGNKSLKLPLEGILTTFGDRACLAFSASESKMSVIGSLLQQKTRVHFNIENSSIGFLANSC